MIYAEAAYFDGNHCHHVAAWEDWKSRERVRIRVCETLDRQRRR